jgi:hypothetical protein
MMDPKKPQINIYLFFTDDEKIELMEMLKKAEKAYKSYIDEMTNILGFINKKKNYYISQKDAEAVIQLSEFIRELGRSILSIPDPYGIILEAMGKDPLEAIMEE